MNEIKSSLRTGVEQSLAGLLDQNMIHGLLNELDELETRYAGIKVANPFESVCRLKETKRVFAVSDGKFRVSATDLDYLNSLIRRMHDHEHTLA